MQISMWRVLGQLLMVALVLQACKKKDEVPPTIEIVSPNNGQLYHVYDTIVVSFKISDETELISAAVEVVNQNFIPVTPKTTISNFNGSAEVILGDKLLQTGDYLLQVSATDGSNDSREFVEIRIIAIPKVRRAVYVATSSGSGEDSMWKVDSLMQQSIAWIQPGQDVLKLCVNSSYDVLGLMGRFSTGLKCYNVLFNNLVWSDHVFTVSQTERYMDLECSEDGFYTTIYDREIRRYGINGALTRNFPTGEFRPEKLFLHDDKLLVEENLVGDNRHVLNVYYEPTNALLWQVDFEVDITGIAGIGNNEVLVFGNVNGQARVFHYDVSENSFWEPRQLPTGKVCNAIELEGGSVAFSHDNGVYVYTYSPNFLSLIRPGSNYRNLVFDVDNGTIIAADGSLLEEFSIAGQLVNSIALSDSIVSFDIHYTR